MRGSSLLNAVVLGGQRWEFDGAKLGIGIVPLF